MKILSKYLLAILCVSNIAMAHPHESEWLIKKENPRQLHFIAHVVGCDIVGQAELDQVIGDLLSEHRISSLTDWTSGQLSLAIFSFCKGTRDGSLYVYWLSVDFVRPSRSDVGELVHAQTLQNYKDINLVNDKNLILTSVKKNVKRALEDYSASNHLDD